MNILVVDDFKSDREMLAQPFRADHDVRCAVNLDEVNQVLENWWPDVALVDAMFPKKRNGSPVFAFEAFLELIEEKRAINLEMPQVVMVSGQNEAAKKFDEVRHWLTFGRVADVIPKSTADVGVEFFQAVVRLRVEALLDRQRWRGIQNNAQSTSEWFAHLGIITTSPRVLELRTHLIAAARSQACVLLTGRMGCGKELFAQAIRKLARPGKKFKEVDCGIIAPELFEAEMFGIKGAKPPNPPFVEKQGVFEAVGDGTLFLDEIHNLKWEHQAKLLHVLQERKFRKVGATDDTQFHGKFVTATNRDLLDEVEKGAFREDLYYRIAVFTIHIPHLAERTDDIPILAEYFLNEFVRARREQGQSCPDIHLHPKSRALLVSAPWKGNVRELRGVIEKTAELALVECAEAEAGVVIDPNLLVKYNPLLGPPTPQITTYDKLLETSGIKVQRWSELDEDKIPAITEAITARLSGEGKIQFATMEAALRPRDSDAGESTPGRVRQDPATIHCLKALLYLLLRTDNRATIQDFLEVLGLKAWAQRKKVMNVLAAQEPSLRVYSAFVKLPSQGRQEAQLVREMMKPKDLLDPS
jgi:DNA-binding NtrC family response regulator